MLECLCNYIFTKIRIKDCYKIKLRASGYRLVYRVHEDRVIIQVIAVGKRDKSEVYRLVHHRMG